MPAYLSWYNHADDITLSTTTSGTMLRPLTELQVPFAKGLCRGPANGGASTPATLVIRGYWPNGINPHIIGLVGLNGTPAEATLKMSYTSAGGSELYNDTQAYTPFLTGSADPLGAAIYFPLEVDRDTFMPTQGTVKYIEITINVYDLPSGSRHVDLRRLLIMSGGGSTLGFDRGWSIFTDDTSKDTQTPRGGVYITEEQSSRVMRFSMTGRSKVELRDAVRGFYYYDCLERVLTMAGKRKEVIACPRRYTNQTDVFKNTIYGRITEWGPIVHDGGNIYSCDGITVKEIPHPPL